MVCWSGKNSGPPESPKQLPSPSPLMPMPEAVTNRSSTAGSIGLRSLTVAL